MAEENDPPAHRLGELLEMYQEGLERIWALQSEEQRAAMAADPVMASVLLMHDLHPVALADRVQEALDSVRPYLDSHGGDVELVSVEDGVAHLKLQGSCHGCGASQTTIELAIEEALEATAPDLLGLEVEGVVERPRRAEATAEAEWVVVPGAEALGRFETMLAGGLLVANVAGTLLAYRDRCACGALLDAATLDGGRLRCPACARTFDLPRAGRCVEAEGVQLEPVPLLRRDGAVRVAVEPAAEESEGCELCGIGVGVNHRHLLHLVDRRILCVCESCWSLRSGDPEFRPPGARTVWLDEMVIPDHIWAAFQIPIGLAFMIRSSVSGGIVALYPSPAGATESELALGAWDELVALHPELDRLEPDAEALVVNRMATPAQHAIVPVDQAYRLVGLVKERWEGISGGTELESAVAAFFADIRGEAVAA